MAEMDGTWQGVILVDTAGNPVGASAGGAAADGVLDAGEAHIGQVGGHGLAIVATLNGAAPVLAAAGDYAANDVFSDDPDNSDGQPFIFAGAARVSGGSGRITRTAIDFSVAALTARVRVHFFNAAPTTSQNDDNAAFSLTAADRTKHIGHIDLPALTNFGEVSKAQNISDRLPFDLAAGTDLYAIGQFLDAVADEVAGMTCSLMIFVEQD